MKKTIIIILAMLFFIAIPILASTPENENAPVPTSEDQQFMGLTQLSEEDLLTIIGNVITSDSITYDTEQCTPEMMKIRELERRLLYDKLLREQAKNFNIPYNILNSAITGIMTALATWGIDSASAGAITAAIVAASSVNPYVAIALATMGATYLTSLVMHYIQNN
jgi:hypothetical protein